ncbi:hypothetical protein [Saccharothrix australiensis]|uniref:Uncharacterized protein n=1 Tax=Saccharothrix australiensis TaxID=2072 RepID=A0A495W6M5_9PSEU|nr:hypothetical protein [Saccharothrix australiensis]RKT56740.1 hypothetical protein C8E97_5450 [Saccharothrix australiensis]
MAPLPKRPLLGRRHRPHPGDELFHRTVGNATVVHAKGAVPDEALSLALSVPVDPDHDVVIVDLPAESPFNFWESLASSLADRRKGVRLVVGGRSRETMALAGQWLAERLGRTVVVPDGTVVRGAGGSLFVHAGRGSGWVRFHRGRPPQWEAKRFPRPSWDSRAVADTVPTSATGVAEPLPGGVWIRPVGEGRRQWAARNHLIAELPCQPDVLAVVLGCPGGAEVSLDDVARFFVTVHDDIKPKVRFVHYGPVRHPAHLPLGQALANSLRVRAVCYTGLPVGAAHAPDVFTVQPDGSLGWNTFVQQVAYEPREDDQVPAEVAPHRYRPPIQGVAEVAPAVFWYAPDAVVEVVRAGLWVRPTHHLVNAEAVRAAPVDAAASMVVFDGAGQGQTDRMRMLAEDVLGRLDYPTRQVSRLVPAAALRRPEPVVAYGPAAGHVAGEAAGGRDPGADLGAAGARAAEALGAEAGGVDPDGIEAGTERIGTFPAIAPPITAPEPVDMPVEHPAPPPGATTAAGTSAPTGGLSADVTGAPTGGLSADVTGAPTGGLSADVTGAPTRGSADDVTAAGTPEPTGAPTPEPPPARTPSAVPFPPVAMRLESTPVDAPGIPPSPPSPRPDPDVGPPPAGPPGGTPPADVPHDPVDPRAVDASTTGAAEQPPADEPPAGTDAVPTDHAPTDHAPTDAAPTDAAPTDAAPDLSATRQPTPRSVASALLPAKGIDKEREWLRKNLGPRFGVMANTIARVLSEHPGFQGTVSRSSSDVLTEAVAVRHYLSAEGADVDRALRAATVGPHVPLARCVVAGLQRLPSHRGSTVFTMTPTSAQWDLYTRHRLFTEWGFLNALTDPCAGLEGSVDVLVWSMTARRTRLLEPDDAPVEDRVLFVPGTSFKVLDVSEPTPGGRGRVLLRELAATEIDADGRVDANRSSLDDLARTALRRSAEAWAGTARPRRVPSPAADRFRRLPGLG